MTIDRDATASPPEARAASNAVDASDGLTWLPAWKLAEMIAHRDVSSVDVVPVVTPRAMSDG